MSAINEQRQLAEHYADVCKGKDYITGYRSQDRVSYTPYTPEKWEELNK